MFHASVPMKERRWLEVLWRRGCNSWGGKEENAETCAGVDLCSMTCCGSEKRQEGAAQRCTSEEEWVNPQMWLKCYLDSMRMLCACAVVEDF